MNDRIPPRDQLRVKQRRRVVQYAEGHRQRAGSRHFGLARRTVRAWFRRWKSSGEVGLVPRYRVPAPGLGCHRQSCPCGVH
jgi:transposase